MVTWWDRLEALGSAVGGVATGATLFWLVWAELRTRKQTRQQARRTQAEGVFAWVELGPRDDEGQCHEGWYLVRNESSLPVAGVTLWAPSPTVDGHLDYGIVAIGLLPPGAERREDIPSGAVDLFFWPAPLAFWFHDAAGIRWFRDESGALHEWEPNKARLEAKLDADLAEAREAVVEITEPPAQ